MPDVYSSTHSALKNGNARPLPSPPFIFILFGFGLIAALAIVSCIRIRSPRQKGLISFNFPFRPPWTGALRPYTSVSPGIGFPLNPIDWPFSRTDITFYLSPNFSRKIPPLHLFIILILSVMHTQGVFSHNILLHAPDSRDCTTFHSFSFSFPFSILRSRSCEWKIRDPK